MIAPIVPVEVAVPASFAVTGVGFGTEVGVAQQGWWDDDHDGWGWGGWLVMMGFMVVFWAVVAILVVWAVRSLGGGRPSQTQPEPPRSPLDIARALRPRRDQRRGVRAHQGRAPALTGVRSCETRLTTSVPRAEPGATALHHRWQRYLSGKPLGSNDRCSALSGAGEVAGSPSERRGTRPGSPSRRSKTSRHCVPE